MPTSGFGSVTVIPGADPIGRMLEPAAANGGGAVPLPAAAQASTSPKELYETAYGYLLQSDYGAAEVAFEEFLRRYPGDRQAADAQYWYGETLYVQRRYKPAAQAFPVLFEKAGLVGVFATGNRGVTLEKLDALIDEEVEKVKAEGVTAEEFTKALNGKEDELARENSQMSARARNLARARLTWGDTAAVNGELDRYLAVKREDLQRVAKKYLVKEQTYRLHYPVLEAPKQPEGAAK